MMDVKNPFIIDFGKLGGPVYVGRARGEAVRLKLKLNDIDATDDLVEVIIPDDTYAINSSFFLGLFGNSIRKAGSRNDFLMKFKFKCKETFLDVIESCIVRALQEKKPIF